MSTSRKEQRKQFRRDVYATLHSDANPVTKKGVHSSASNEEQLDDALRRELEAKFDELFGPITSD